MIKIKLFFLLSSLLKSYEGFVDTILYGRITLTLRDIIASISSEVTNGEELVAKTERKKHKNKNHWSVVK